MSNRDINNRRIYQRTDTNCDAKYSLDGKGGWTEADVADISSGGLQMYTEEEFETGDKLFFDVVLYGLSAQLEFCTQGTIRRKKHVGLYYIYGVSFQGLSGDLKIHIDELIMHMRPKNFLI